MTEGETKILSSLNSYLPIWFVCLCRVLRVLSTNDGFLYFIHGTIFSLIRYFSGLSEEEFLVHEWAFEFPAMQ